MMGRVIVAILGLWSFLPVIFAYLFFQEGQYEIAYWLIVVPAVTLLGSIVFGWYVVQGVSGGDGDD